MHLKLQFLHFKNQAKNRENQNKQAKRNMNCHA